MRRHKFNVAAKENRQVDGITFASKGEALRYVFLKQRQRNNEISDLKLQPAFPLVVDGRPVLIRSDRYPNGRKCKYTADFSYREGGIEVIEDYKGRDTKESRLRRAVAEAIYGFCVRITGPAGQGRAAA